MARRRRKSRGLGRSNAARFKRDLRRDTDNLSDEAYANRECATAVRRLNDATRMDNCDVGALWLKKVDRYCANAPVNLRKHEHTASSKFLSSCKRR